MLRIHEVYGTELYVRRCAKGSELQAVIALPLWQQGRAVAPAARMGASSRLFLGGIRRILKVMPLQMVLSTDQLLRRGGSWMGCSIKPMDVTTPQGVLKF